MSSSGSSFPGLESILPHGGGMIFIEEILRHGSEATECRVTPGEGDVDPDKGPLAPWVGIEYMGQAACVHTVLASGGGEAPGAGLLIGARELDVAVGQLPRGEPLIARAQTLLGQGTLRSMRCSLEVEADGRGLMEGRLNAFVPEDPEDLFGEGSP